MASTSPRNDAASSSAAASSYAAGLVEMELHVGAADLRVAVERHHEQTPHVVRCRSVVVLTGDDEDGIFLDPVDQPVLLVDAP